MSNSFGREVAVVPVSIGDIALEVFNPNPLGSEVATAITAIQVLMDDGSVRVRKFNLLNHYTVQQINSMGAILMAAIRTKAETEILPAAS